MMSKLSRIYMNSVFAGAFKRLTILIMLLLISGCATPSALTMAIEKGDVATVKTLLDKGVNPHEVANCGSGNDPTTPLLCAVKFDQPVVINYLIDKGANPNEVYYTFTPLSMAASYNKNRIAKVLLERGANPNVSAPYVDKPLKLAAYKGNIDLMKLLIANGADIDTTIEDLRTWKDSWLPDHNKKIDSAVRRLENLKPRPAAAAPAAASQAQQVTITKEEIAAMLQTAVEKAGKKEMKSGAMASSDIDRPLLTETARIMGDNDLAVVIGIEGYQNLPKSDYSYADARLVKDYVKALGFKERNIELITDEKATRSGIAKAVEVWLKNKSKEDSRIFVYYSGHGAPDPSTGEAYLVPYDGDPNYLSVTGYPLKMLYSNLGKLQVREVIVILDSCFSGAGGRSVLAKGARPLVMSAAPLSIASNIAILTATQGAQISTSSSEKGHGIFTYYFLKALKDGKKNVAEIYQYLKPLVEDDAKAINVQQSPSLNPEPEKLTGKFNLRK
jgi:hypothetical protein